MTLTQVSTWFANARRRLKKENKWSPTSGFEDDDSSSSPNKSSSVLGKSSSHTVCDDKFKSFIILDTFLRFEF